MKRAEIRLSDCQIKSLAIARKVADDCTLEDVDKAFHRVCDDEAALVTITPSLRVTPIEITLEPDYARTRGYGPGRFVRVNGSCYEILSVVKEPSADRCRVTLGLTDYA